MGLLACACGGVGEVAILAALAGVLAAAWRYLRKRFRSPVAS